MLSKCYWRVPLLAPKCEISNQDNHFAKQLILSGESKIELICLVLFDTFECFQKVIGGYPYCPRNEKLQIRIMISRNSPSLVVKAKQSYIVYYFLILLNAFKRLLAGTIILLNFKLAKFCSLWIRIQQKLLNCK